MIPRLFLLLLCLPLYLLAFPDPANPLAEWGGDGGRAPGNAEEWKNLRNDLDEKALAARDLVRLKDSVVLKAALLLSEECREKGDTYLEEALAGRLERLAVARRFLRLYAAKVAGADPGDVGDVKAVKDDKVYGPLLKELDTFRENELKITRLAQDYPKDEDDLKRELNAYGKAARTDSDRAFHRSIRAYMGRVDIERTYKLVAPRGGEDLHKQVSDALKPSGETPAVRTGDLPAVREMVEKLLKALADFRKDHQDALFPKWAPGSRPAEWAADQAARWQPYPELLKLAEDRELSLPRRLVRLEDLYGRKAAGDAFGALVRLEMRRACEAALPEKLEPDTHVFVKYLRKPMRVERRSVEVVLRPEPDRPPRPARPLLPFEECTLLMKDIEKVLVNDDGIIYDRELLPTPQTEAAHAYTEGRKDLKWNRASLEKFRERCRRTADMATAWERSELRSCWKTLNDLIEAARKCPELFGPPDESP